MKNSFIQLDRKILSWQWYRNANVFRVFIHCLLRANYKDHMFEDSLIERGSFATSYDKIGDSLGLSRQQVRTAMSKLKDSEILKTKATPKYLLVSIVKYSDYQGNYNKNNTEITPNQHENNTTITPSNNINNINNDNNIIEIEEAKKICLSDSKWIEAVMNNFLLNDHQFQEYINTFTNHATLNGTTSTSPEEYRQYFVRWYKKTTGKGMNGRKIIKSQRNTL